MRVSPLTLALLLGSMAGSPASHAAGFGALPSSVAMGSPLNLPLPLQLDDGDVIEPDCVAVEVLVGDRRVPPYNVRLAIEPGAQPRDRVLRVATLTSVDEPVVAVQLNIGCGLRLSRRFTVFADPPALMAAPGVAEPVDEGGRPSAATTAAARASEAAAPRERLAAASGQDAPRASGGRQAPPRAQTVAKPTGKVSRAAKEPVVRLPDQAAEPRGRSRLSLEPTVVAPDAGAAAALQAAASAVASFGQAASAAQAAASAAEARTQVLEAQVEKLLAEGRAQRTEIQQLRNRMSAGEGGSGAARWMFALLLLALAGIAWLTWRLQVERRRIRSRWWDEAQSQASSATHADAAVDPRGPMGPLSDAAPRPQPPELSDFGPGAAVGMAETAPMALSTPHVPMAPLPRHDIGWQTSTPPRPVSVEELIDLEQQAEFFVVLGQDDAAIDLLVGHIRNTGGISPLPYLKLLEIYRRRGETDNYERTRARFNLRFNAYAPEWSADLQHGRLLAEYPEVIATLQAAWPRPLDAMAELEALLFRKDDGQMFDLPAYREVLLLYSLARDLLDNHGAPTAPVDLLLPLDASKHGAASKAAVAKTTTRSQAMDDTRPLVRGGGPVESNPDLDLNLSAFGVFDDGVTRPGAFTDLDGAGSAGAATNAPRPARAPSASDPWGPPDRRQS